MGRFECSISFQRKMVEPLCLSWESHSFTQLRVAKSQRSVFRDNGCCGTKGIGGSFWRLLTDVNLHERASNTFQIRIELESLFVRQRARCHFSSFFEQLAVTHLETGFLRIHIQRCLGVVQRACNVSQCLADRYELFQRFWLTGPLFQRSRIVALAVLPLLQFEL